MSLEDRNYWNFGPLPNSSRKVIKLKCPHNVKKNREIQLKFIINQLTYSLWNGTTHAKINLITLSTSNARQQLIAYIFSVPCCLFFLLIIPSSHDVLCEAIQNMLKPHHTWN